MDRMVSGTGARVEHFAPDRAQCDELLHHRLRAADVPGRGGRQAVRRAFVAGPGKVLIKSGAEGVYCGALPARGLGFALKVDDGAKRAAEAVVTALVARVCPQMAALGPASRLTNWRGQEVGQVRAAPALVTGLAALF